MSNLYCKDFHHRLTELNNWQIEQQKKIKSLQETQKRLLTMERLNLLPTSVSELSNRACTSKEDYLSNACDETINTKNNRDGHKLNNNNLKDASTAQLKLPNYKLQEPTLSWFDGDCSPVARDEDYNNDSEKIYKAEEKKSTSPKKFLKRGDGLARFRMSLADFKKPPKIYREKKIRTYVNSKPVFVVKKLNNQNVKSHNQRHTTMGSNQLPKTSRKSLSIPVNIYVSDNKAKVGNKKKTETKQTITLEDPLKKNDDVRLQQSTKQYLKLCSIKQPNSINEKMNCHGKDEIPNDHGSGKVDVCFNLDVENKKDDKELKIFEILEQKINDNSFCSSSSFVDRLMEHSLTCTPSKSSTKEVKLCVDPSLQGMKSPSLEFLCDENKTKIEDVNELELNPSNKEQIFKPNENCIDLLNSKESVPFEDITGRDSEGENDGIRDIGVGENEKSEIIRSIFDHSQPYKVNKELLEKYVKDFKMLKFNFSKAVHGMEELKEEMSHKVSNNEEKEEVISQHDIDMKLQRKGLQDNVKHLMNWENPSRKRLAKRTLKKVKLKPKKVEKAKTVDNDQTEKITFNSALLKARLDELEKEIEIFRKENKILENLQKECNAERLKLARERKEFEKQMAEEKEKLKASISEERKKLQKEKVVFEKYCKQIKNQPNRQEREEIANLKKEIENLRETLTAKESRWGSSQARLRNQIKVLQKENTRLKSESDEYKKLPIRKVTFENDGSINTKIINAVNSEMNKLKPAVIKDTNGGSLHTKNKSLSARVGKNIERKPIRRIKSDPNMKKPGLIDLINDFPVHDKAASSVSKDSGIETNEPLCISVSQSSKILPCNIYKFSKTGDEEKSKGRFEGSYACTFGELSDHETDVSEGSSHESIVSFTQEAVFDGKETESGDLDLRHSGGCYVSDETSDHVENPTRVPAASSGYDKAIDVNENEMSLLMDSRSRRNQSRETDFFEKRGIQSKNGLLDTMYCCENYLTDNKIEENNKIRERTLDDGVKEISYPNGNVKKIYPGNKIIKIVYYNGDIKETNALEGSEKYYYAETKTWHTTYRDGFEVLEFPNGQTERRHANGTTEISFPNGCVRYCDGSGRDEWRFPDGAVIKTNEKGHKILLMPNGQKEIHTKEFKRREYPDGTVKMLYADGTQETRYACGRVRLKDKAGNLIMDSEGIS